MRYGLYLLPDAFLLLALLRMTLVHLYSERRAMFCFLVAWLVYCLLALFAGQVHKIDSPEFARIFAVLTVLAWIAGVPAIWLASRRVSESRVDILAVIVVLVIAALAAKLIFANVAFNFVAKTIALHCWACVIAGTVFVLAARHAESPDRLLWRATAAFFLLYGFIYIAIGVARSGAWAYSTLALLTCVPWFVLAWYVGPHPDHLFTLEKLGIIWPLAKYFGIAIPVRRSTP